MYASRILTTQTCSGSHIAIETQKKNQTYAQIFLRKCGVGQVYMTIQ